MPDRKKHSEKKRHLSTTAYKKKKLPPLRKRSHLSNRSKEKNNDPEQLNLADKPVQIKDVPSSTASDVSATETFARASVSPAVVASPSSTHLSRTWRNFYRKRRLGRKRFNGASRLLTTCIVLGSLFILLFLSLFGGSYAYYKSRQPALKGSAEHTLFQTSRIFDRNGTLLYELYDKEIGRGRRVYVDYKNISPLLIQATIAAEDHSFWTNTGVDYTGIGRAAVANIRQQGIVEGGSTITQQLVKNQFFQGQPRTVQIKIEEAILATGLTRQYPKWKIIEMYLNTVFYGDTNYGVEAAAEGLFALKPECGAKGCQPVVSQLTLGQASFLAGLPQSPSYYNPVYYKERALARQQQILNSMQKLGMITRQQRIDAQEEMEKFKFRPYSETHKSQAMHFVNYVIEQLEGVMGAQELRTGGYNIYTTLDLTLQKRVEKIAYEHLYTQKSDNYMGTYGPLYQTNNVNNSAVVVLKPGTGEILAMNGSASHKAELSTPQMQGDFNAAIAPRQPGSSFKPFVYATAFEQGWYPAMIVPDYQTYYPNGADKPYTPQNYDGRFHGQQNMTVRSALANSFNIPAINALQFAGIPNVLNMAGRLGLHKVAQRPLDTLGLSMALGSVEVSPLQMTAAYAVFANRGVRVPTTYISKITNNQGQPVYTFDPARQQGQRVMREEIAFLMNSVLSDNQARLMEFGPGNPLEIDRPAAVKTGTTDSFRDNWTIGYTPHLAVGVWAGNSDNSVMHNIIGVTGAGPIWNDVLTFASKHYKLPPDDFKRPANVHKESVSATSGLLPRPGEAVVTDWFIEGTKPTIQGPEPPPAPRLTCDPGRYRDKDDLKKCLEKIGQTKIKKKKYSSYYDDSMKKHYYRDDDD